MNTEIGDPLFDTSIRADEAEDLKQRWSRTVGQFKDLNDDVAAMMLGYVMYYMNSNQERKQFLLEKILPRYLHESFLRVVGPLGELLAKSSGALYSEATPFLADTPELQEYIDAE